MEFVHPAASVAKRKERGRGCLGEDEPVLAVALEARNNSRAQPSHLKEREVKRKKRVGEPVVELEE